MPDNSPRLDLPFLAPAQAQKHVTINEALRRLDSLVMLTAESRNLAAEPASPQAGQAWLLPSGPTGPVWQGLPPGDFALFEDGAWRSFAPRAGFTAFIRDETLLMVFDGTGWRTLSGPTLELQNLTRLGIGTSADEINPFSAKLNTALWTNRMRSEGGTGDLRYVLNKETAGNVLSLLLQSGFSARAEIGLVGDDDLTLRTSVDGTAFQEALRLRRADGALVASQVQIAALNNGPLGGFRNRLINGDFRVNQRRFAGGALAQGEFGPDRWRANSVGTNLIVHGGNPPVVTLTGEIRQAIENIHWGLAGQSVTVSIGGTSAAPVSFTLEASQGGSGSVSGTIPPGSGRRGVTFIVPETLDQGAALRLAGTNATFSEVMLTPGTVTEQFFEFRPLSIEQLLCMRYFQKPVQMSGTVAETTGNLAILSVLLPVPMRAVPTATFFSAPGAVNAVRPRVAFIRLSAIDSASLSEIGGYFDFTLESPSPPGVPVVTIFTFDLRLSAEL